MFTYLFSYSYIITSFFFFLFFQSLLLSNEAGVYSLALCLIINV